MLGAPLSTTAPVAESTTVDVALAVGTSLIVPPPGLRTPVEPIRNVPELIVWAPEMPSVPERTSRPGPYLMSWLLPPSEPLSVRGRPVIVPLPTSCNAAVAGTVTPFVEPRAPALLVARTTPLLALKALVNVLLAERVSVPEPTIVAPPLPAIVPVTAMLPAPVS